MIATYNQFAGSHFSGSQFSGNQFSGSQFASAATVELIDPNFSVADYNSGEVDSANEQRLGAMSEKIGDTSSVASFGDSRPSSRSGSWHMKCECLSERHVFDLLDHVYRLHQEANDGLGATRRSATDQCRGALRDPVAVSGANHDRLTGNSGRVEFATPILIYVTDYQEAVEIDRCLSAVKLRTHLASPFSNWTSVLGKLGTGQLDVIISTTAEIPHADQIPWRAIYLPSALHLAMLTTPQMDWLGNLWFANHIQETPPRLIIRRTKTA